MHDRVFKASDAAKLDDPERLQWLPPGEVVSKLELKPGQTVADIGAGTGYFAIPMARALGELGTIFAVDLQPEMLTLLEARLAGAGVGNVKSVLGQASATGLGDGSCDVVLLAKVWHELEDAAAAAREAARILKPGGKLAILEWRTDVSRPPGPPMDHRLSPDTLAAPLIAEGWDLDGVHGIGFFSYLLVATRLE